MFVTQAHSFRQQARLAVTLAWVAGYTNVLTLLTCDSVSSHVSGTVSQFGRNWALGNWNPAFFATYLLATFLAGATISAFSTETGRRRGWQSVYILPMTLEALLLTIFAIGVVFHDPREFATGSILYAMTGLASLAMGLQNATITRISGGVVRTTHMTGICTDIGLEAVQFLYWLNDCRRGVFTPHHPDLDGRKRSHPSARRLMLLCSLLGCFAMGAGLAAIAYHFMPRAAMFPPVLFLVWLILQDLRTPVCRIEPATMTDSPVLAFLPATMGIYHLRKNNPRSSKRHRLPDLLRWYERLPHEKSVVILDLMEATSLDANVALQLRALMAQSAESHRELVLSGITAAQLAAVRRGGADLLDASNVCPDLDLAIARGLFLSEEMTVLS